MNTSSPSACDAASWAVVVPAKHLSRAKSRLGAALGENVRRALAQAMLADVLCALGQAAQVGTVAVVCCDPELEFVARQLGALVVIEPEEAAGAATGAAGDPSFRAAAAAGLAWAAGHGPRRAVVAADLPGATAAEFDEVLAAARAPRAHLVDADGSGTTMATFCRYPATPTYFGPASATAFAAAGSVPLGAPAQWPGLRRDVDVLAHLRALPRVGAHTAAALTAAGLSLPTG